MSLTQFIVPAMGLISSTHARRRMAERGITPPQVAEALMNVEQITEGRTLDRINLWGRTLRGRRLRITQYRGASEFVITVVAPGEERT